MDKVKLPREVVEALDALSKRYSKRNVLAILLKGGLVDDMYEGLLLKEVSILRDTEFEDILLALVNGYEIEETPEDRILRHYNNPDLDKWNPNSFRMGIRIALHELGIKIRGVNDRDGI